MYRLLVSTLLPEELILESIISLLRHPGDLECLVSNKAIGKPAIPTFPDNIAKEL